MSRIEELEKRLAADPNSRMFVQLAEEYRKAGMLDQAIDVCEQGLKKHPQYPSARVALGRALLEAGTFDRACAEFESVLKQVPDNILANKFLGETYQRLGRFDDAMKKYRVAHTLAPEDTEIDDRIREVQAALAGGGPARTPAPQPSSASAPTAPIPRPPAPPAAPRPASPAPPPPSALVEPQEPEVERTARMVDLPPIPLVEVDEPMVLENRDYIPPPRSAERPPSTTAKVAAPPPPPVFTELEPERLLEPTMVDPPRAPSRPAPPAAAAPSRPPPAAAAAPSRPSPPAAEIETPTMAEIYADQGHFDQALAVYRRILERQPNEPKYRERAEELQMLALATSAPAPPPVAAKGSGVISDSFDAHERTLRVLEDWLEAIRRSKVT